MSKDNNSHPSENKSQGKTPVKGKEVYFQQDNKENTSKRLESLTLEELILMFDTLNSTGEDALHFIAWLQLELKNVK